MLRLVLLVTCLSTINAGYFKVIVGRSLSWSDELSSKGDQGKPTECLERTRTNGDESNSYGDDIGTQCCRVADDGTVGIGRFFTSKQANGYPQCVIQGTRSTAEKLCCRGVDYDTAKALCESIGDRLCTFDEANDATIQDNRFDGSGCDFDAHHVWTSTPCDPVVPQQISNLEDELLRVESEYKAADDQLGDDLRGECQAGDQSVRDDLIDAFETADNELRTELAGCCNQHRDSVDIGCSLSEWTTSSAGTITEESGRLKFKSKLVAFEDIYVEKVFRLYVDPVISYSITSLRLEIDHGDYFYIKYKCDDDVNFIEEKLVDGILEETTVNDVLDLSGAICNVLTIRFGIYVSGGSDDLGYLNCPVTIAYDEHDSDITRITSRMNYLEEQLNNLQSSTAKTAYNLYDNNNNNNDDIYKYTSTDLILVTLINISISLLMALCVCKLSKSSGKNNQYRSVSTLSAIDTE